jgi:hypothetical protein
MLAHVGAASVGGAGFQPAHGIRSRKPEVRIQKPDQRRRKKCLPLPAVCVIIGPRGKQIRFGDEGSRRMIGRLSTILLLTCAAGLAQSGAGHRDLPAQVDLSMLLDAIAMVESNNNPAAIGDGGRAAGAYQIHRAYWTDGTRLLKVDWDYSEAFNPEKARRVVEAYLLHYGRGLAITDLARIHNGGPDGHRQQCTLSYAEKIRKTLEEYQIANSK